MKTLQKIFLFVTAFLLFLIVTFLLRLKLSIQDSNVLTERGNIMIDLIEKVNHQSDWDNSEEYRITYNLARPASTFYEDDITLVVQCSAQNLHHIKNLTKMWQGPISIAVFSKAVDVVQTVTAISQLIRCVSGISHFVTFHVVTFDGNGNIRLKHTADPDCETQLEPTESRPNYHLTIPYPVNLMRNVALRGVTTKYMLLTDVDMTPSPGLRETWLGMDKSALQSNTVYIVPAFEIERKVPPPPTKVDAMKLVKNGIMRPFYFELCAKCHACVGYSTWYDLPPSEGLSVGYRTAWSDPCEPFYISTTNIPAYDEAFKQYGFNRISQVCELYMAGYKFAVLDNAYLVHIGMKTKDDFHDSKNAEQESNRKLFREFKHRLKYKYSGSSRTC